MNLPALRGNIGDWTYYVVTLTFGQIRDHVKMIDDELHQSKKLSELIQRSITNNYISIKEYIEKQDERFFNALVLAVYDGDPQWVEVELNYKDQEYFNLGFLALTGEEKIFPVDGQHRVEGIKAALRDHPELVSEKIPAIMIGHRKTKEGMAKSRRLFTTLNRYAKPVTWDDIIALDEDDCAAIYTRSQLESNSLFSGDRTVIAKQKAIPESNQSAITSIITLYQANRELADLFYWELKKKGKDLIEDRPDTFGDFLKYRRPDSQYQAFELLCNEFWNEFQSQITPIKKYYNDKGTSPAKAFRNRKNGGNLLFRPVGLVPFVQAVKEVRKKTGDSFKNIMSRFNQYDFSLNQKPWVNLVWNKTDKTMIMGNKGLTKRLLIFLYDENLLTTKAFTKLKEDYAAKVGITRAVDRQIKSLLK